MDLKLAGKKALVTGSTKGIGFSIALLLSREGASVVVNGRTSDAVNKAVKEIESEAKAKVEGIAADLGTRAGVDELVQKLPSVDILVNNLGIYEVKSFPDITDEDWLHIFEVNVLSGIRLSRAYMPAMLKKDWGRIVFISSESAVNIPVEMVHYGFSKTAQLSVARGLAEMTAGTRVTVNSVLPGPTLSEGVQEFVNNMAKQQGVSKEKVEEDFFKTVRPTSLIKRFATADEVAAMVTFVCSELSSATNGAALRVEGGCVKSIL